jgi:hypothetical protein
MTCTKTFDNGSEYVGLLQNGLKHGVGVLKNSDGSVYDGNFY